MIDPVTVLTSLSSSAACFDDKVHLIGESHASFVSDLDAILFPFNPPLNLSVVFTVLKGTSVNLAMFMIYEIASTCIIVVSVKFALGPCFYKV